MIILNDFVIIYIFFKWSFFHVSSLCYQFYLCIGNTESKTLIPLWIWQK